jgi:hypothetical protein
MLEEVVFNIRNSGVYIITMNIFKHEHIFEPGLAW